MNFRRFFEEVSEEMKSQQAKTCYSSDNRNFEEAPRKSSYSLGLAIIFLLLSMVLFVIAAFQLFFSFFHFLVYAFSGFKEWRLQAKFHRALLRVRLFLACSLVSLVGLFAPHICISLLVTCFALFATASDDSQHLRSWVNRFGSRAR